MNMKSLIKAVAVAAVLAVPALSFAQSNQPVTRAQVRAELVQLEKTGYSPFDSSDAHYPAAVQRAEARVTTDTTGYGPATAGTAQSGARGPVYNQFLGSPYDHS
jgi:opacity protein-like surface antigen